MKRIRCMLAMFTLAAVFASSALAARAPDADVKGRGGYKL